MPSIICLMDSSVERSLSVSSILKINFPPLCRAKSQLKRAVLTPPTCRYPVGLGANLTLISFINFILSKEIPYTLLSYQKELPFHTIQSVSSCLRDIDNKERRSHSLF